MRYLTQERNGGGSNLASRSVVRGIALGGITLVLAVMHVWLNIERVDLAYRYRAIEEEIQNKAALVNKLQLERENLISPYRLKEMSNSLGLQPAQPGQIRNLALMAGELGATAP
ncbi:MAG: hypothetical protein LDL30_08975 [Desulfovibrio sp.]|nr:hypothetical protein [Desulfovibrio sp.]MCA1985023.1 hypothetical protein [Desulfovibrio sp.]